MHIKRVTLSGFKSYKEQFDLEDFSPYHNVIVGRNGSGKSNFFEAIRFVLFDKYVNLRQEERQRLLHEGAGTTVVNAFVEVVFDNTAGRFPLDCDEVTLRRTIGLKKDELFLNRKRKDKKTVISYLESAGFSRSNPYYIVQQGKVNALATMKDSERLNLLKEVAGTKVYEERKNESIKLIQSTEAAVNKTSEYITLIETRLNELRGEKEELMAYQSLDKRRRTCEYYIYEKALSEAKQDLEIVAAQKNADVEQAQSLFDRLVNIETAMQNADQSFGKLESQIRLMESEKRGMEKDKRDIQEEIVQTELVMRDIQDSIANVQSRKTTWQNELADVESEITLANRNLKENSAPKYEDLLKRVKSAKEDLLTVDTVCTILQDKASRLSHFKSEKSRNTFLQNEITNLEASLKHKADTLKEIAQTERDATIALTTKRTFAQTLKSTIETLRQNIQSNAQEIQQTKTQRDNAMERRKRLWKKSADGEKKVTKLFEKRARVERALRAAMPRSISNGLRAIREWCVEGLFTCDAEDPQAEIYGPIVELFSVQSNPQMFHVPLAEIAGNGLFHLVVRDDEVAARLIQKLQVEQRGRCSFIPLKQVAARFARMQTSSRRYQANERQIAELDKSQAISLISKLEYDNRFESCMHQIFGHRLLCRDYDTAVQMAQEVDMDCVTLDGDQVTRDGAIKGGYTNRNIVDSSTNGSTSSENSSNSSGPAKTLIDLFREVDNVLEEWKSAKVDLESAQEDVFKVDQVVSNHLGMLEKLHATKQHYIGKLYMERDQFEKVQREILDLESTVKTRKQKTVEQVQKLKRGSRSLQQIKSSLENELASQFRRGQVLSQSERKRLKDAQTRKDILQKEMKELTQELEVSRLDRTALQSRLDKNLFRKRQELKNHIRTCEISINNSSNEKLTECKGMLDRLEKGSQEIENALESMKGELKQMKTDLEQAKTKSTTHEREKAQIEDELREASKRADKRLAKQAILRDQMDEATRKLRELGAVSIFQSDDDHNVANAEDVMMKSGDTAMPNATDGPTTTATLTKRRSLREYTKKELLAEIAKCNTKLVRYKTVNRKAMEQFVNFSDQREELTRRKKELQTDRNAIEELINALDMKKNEDIMGTFRNVSKHFASVFAQLVGAQSEDPGQPWARLELITKLEERQEEDSNIDEDEAKKDNEKDKGEQDSEGNQNNPASEGLNTKMDEIVGIRVLVSFDGRSADQALRVQQLSGGQKTLVALSLIFAIQRADPAPFYLFDEIDQALDQKYRSAVATMITEQSKRGTMASPEHGDNNSSDVQKQGGNTTEAVEQQQKQEENRNGTQFITSTFRPELVRVADKCYGIAHRDKLSEIHILKKSEALEFIENLMDVRSGNSGVEIDHDSRNRHHLGRAA
eukprot:g1236.t1